MIWGFALWLACTNVGKIPSKSDAWLEDHLRSSTSIEGQLVMIEEMGVRRNPNSVTVLVQKASSPEVEIRKASVKALVAFGPNFVDDRRDQQYLASLEDDNRGVRKLHLKESLSGCSLRSSNHISINGLLSRAREPSTMDVANGVARIDCNGSTVPMWTTFVSR